LDSKKPTKEELVERATKALQVEMTSFFGQTQKKSPNAILNDLPKVSLSQVLQMFRADSVAMGGVNTILDRILENGYSIRSRKTGKTQPKHEAALRNKGFDFFLREVIFHFILFQNAFVEFVYTSNKGVKEFHTLDPTNIDIKTDKHNDVKLYVQKTTGEAVTWQPDEVLHIKDVAVDLTQWGEVTSKTIFDAIITKVHINKFETWLFSTNQFRGIYNIKAADPESIKRSITFLKESERNINKPVIFEGEFNYFVSRELKDLQVLNELIYKKDEEILNMLQVPPIYAGLPDNSNRSNSDAQERAFNTTIKARQAIVKLNMDSFLKRMSLFDSEFVFNPISTKISREVVEVAQLMKDMSVKEDLIADFLRESGLLIPQGDIFEEPPEMIPGQMPGEEQTGNDTLSPSRRPKPAGEGNKQIGTGERGTTRQDQLVKRTEDKHYYYEPLQEPQA